MRPDLFIESRRNKSMDRILSTGVLSRQNMKSFAPKALADSHNFNSAASTAKTVQRPTNTPPTRDKSQKNDSVLVQNLAYQPKKSLPKIAPKSVFKFRTLGSKGPSREPTPSRSPITTDRKSFVLVQPGAPGLKNHSFVNPFSDRSLGTSAPRNPFYSPITKAQGALRSVTRNVGYNVYSGRETSVYFCDVKAAYRPFLQPNSKENLMEQTRQEYAFTLSPSVNVKSEESREIREFLAQARKALGDLSRKCEKRKEGAASAGALRERVSAVENKVLGLGFKGLEKALKKVMGRMGLEAMGAN